MRKGLREKLLESLRSVLPITALVLFLSVSLAPLGTGVLTLFVFGALQLILGIGLFTLGADMSMQPLGEGLGVTLGRMKHFVVPAVIALVLGALITTSEPDLRVLANQVPTIPDAVLIVSVAVGVGVFLIIGLFRVRRHIPLNTLLLVFYGLILLLAVFAPASFVPAAFDSGGVTTGPMTVPFLMALGSGLAAERHKESAGEASFGLVAVCSIGPILSVLLLSIFFKPEASTSARALMEVHTTKEAFLSFIQAAPQYAGEVLFALLPILIVLILYQLLTRRFRHQQLLRIIVGIVYMYVGMVLFLTAANVGFMPAGQLIGKTIGSGEGPWILIPVGLVMGYFIVAAEPAVHVLKKQVEEVTSGIISQSSIAIGLSIGVGVSIALSMLRMIAGLPLFPILAAGYGLSLLMSFFVPKVYTGIAFDAGGVASGPMATTFILPFAMGACEALGGDLLTDAFGVVALVALTPLITIQAIGLFGRMRSRIRTRQAALEILDIPDTILYYDKGYESIKGREHIHAKG